MENGKLFTTQTRGTIVKQTENNCVIKYTREQYYVGIEIEEEFGEGITHIAEGYDGKANSDICAIYYADGSIHTFGDKLCGLKETEEDAIADIMRGF